MMGGALGLAVLASLAAHAHRHARAPAPSALAALNGGYHAAFLAGALFAAAAAAVAAALLRSGTSPAADAHGALAAESH